MNGEHDVARIESSEVHHAVRSLGAGEIRARRRPRAIVVLYVWQLLAALVLATPIHAWAKQVWGSHPEGDAVLFRPGGYELVGWLLDGGAALRVVAESSWMLLSVSVLLGQLPLASLLVALVSGRGPRALRPDGLSTFRAALALLVPFVITLFLTLLLQGIVIFAGLFVADKAADAIAASVGEAPAFAVQATIAALFVLLAGWVSAEADVARAAMAIEHVSRATLDGSRAGTFGLLRRGLQATLRASVRTRLRAFGAWLSRVLLGLLAIGAGSLLADRIGGQGGGVLIALALVHQLIVLGRTALRASWLARAARWATDARADQPARDL